MVAIVIPVYNVKRYLKTCIESALNQTYKSVVVILVDDGSTDGSGDLCDIYKALDNRIVVIHKNNGGLSSARNAGLDIIRKSSSIQWCFFLDGDDYIHPYTIEWLVAATNNSEKAIAICPVQYVADGSEPFDVGPFGFKKFQVEDFWTEYPIDSIVACGKLFRKELWEDVYFPEGKLHEDEYTTYKVLFKVSDVLMLQNPCYYYLQRADSIMGGAWNKQRLDLLEAKKEQIRFFKHTGRNKIAYDVRIKYICAISDGIRHLRELGDPCADKLRKKLYCELKKVNAIKNYNFGQNYDVYHTAYPLIVNNWTWLFIRGWYLLNTQGIKIFADKLNELLCKCKR